MCRQMKVFKINQFTMETSFFHLPFQTPEGILITNYYLK